MSSKERESLGGDGNAWISIEDRAVQLPRGAEEKRGRRGIRDQHSRDRQEVHPSPGGRTGRLRQEGDSGTRPCVLGGASEIFSELPEDDDQLIEGILGISQESLHDRAQDPNLRVAADEKGVPDQGAHGDPAEDADELGGGADSVRLKARRHERQRDPAVPGRGREGGAEEHGDTRQRQDESGQRSAEADGRVDAQGIPRSAPKGGSRADARVQQEQDGEDTCETVGKGRIPRTAEGQQAGIRQGLPRGESASGGYCGTHEAQGPGDDEALSLSGQGRQAKNDGESILPRKIGSPVLAGKIRRQASYLSFDGDWLERSSYKEDVRRTALIIRERHANNSERKGRGRHFLQFEPPTSFSKKDPAPFHPPWGGRQSRHRCIPSIRTFSESSRPPLSESRAGKAVTTGELPLSGSGMGSASSGRNHSAPDSRSESSQREGRGFTGANAPDRDACNLPSRLMSSQRGEGRSFSDQASQDDFGTPSPHQRSTRLVRVEKVLWPDLILIASSRGELPKRGDLL